MARPPVEEENGGARPSELLEKTHGKTRRVGEGGKLVYGGKGAEKVGKTGHKQRKRRVKE